MISVPQAHLMHHICLRKMLHCDNCVLHPPFSFSGLLLKLTYFFHCSYILGFSQWQLLTCGPGNLGKTSFTFFSPVLRTHLSPASTPPSLDTLTKPFFRTHVSKMLGSFMHIIQIISISPFCTLHFWAWFCISQKLLQFSYFMELTASVIVVQSLRFILCLITDLPKEVVARGIWELKGTSLCSPVWLQSGLLVSNLDWRLNGLE